MTRPDAETPLSRCRRLHPECCAVNSNSKVKIEERNTKAIFENSAGQDFIIVQMDGCLVKEAADAQRRADKIVWRADVGQLIVELKGSDVHHAVSQIEGAIVFLKQRQLLNAVFSALVVCRNNPLPVTQMQTLQVKFRKSHRAALTVSAKDAYRFEALFPSR